MRLSYIKISLLQITYPAQERLATSATGIYTIFYYPLLFLNSGVGSFTSHKNQISESVVSKTYSCIVFHPYLRRLEIADVIAKAAIFSQLFI